MRGSPDPGQGGAVEGNANGHDIAPVDLSQGDVAATAAFSQAPPHMGVHLLLDIWGGLHLDDPAVIRRMIHDVTRVCGATLCDYSATTFEPYTGLTAFATLLESHFTVHTWPEHEYAAADLFTCGRIDPYPAVAVVDEVLQPRHLLITEHKRGVRCRTATRRS